MKKLLFSLLFSSLLFSACQKQDLHSEFDMSEEEIQMALSMDRIVDETGLRPLLLQWNTTTLQDVHEHYMQTINTYPDSKELDYYKDWAIRGMLDHYGLTRASDEMLRFYMNELNSIDQCMIEPKLKMLTAAKHTLSAEEYQVIVNSSINKASEFVSFLKRQKDYYQIEYPELVEEKERHIHLFTEYVNRMKELKDDNLS